MKYSGAESLNLHLLRECRGRVQDGQRVDEVVAARPPLNHREFRDDEVPHLLVTLAHILKQLAPAPGERGRDVFFGPGVGEDGRKEFGRLRRKFRSSARDGGDAEELDGGGDGQAGVESARGIQSAEEAFLVLSQPPRYDALVEFAVRKIPGAAPLVREPHQGFEEFSGFFGPRKVFADDKRSGRRIGPLAFDVNDLVFLLLVRPEEQALPFRGRRRALVVPPDAGADEIGKELPERCVPRQVLVFVIEPRTQVVENLLYRRLLTLLPLPRWLRRGGGGLCLSLRAASESAPGVLFLPAGALLENG